MSDATQHTEANGEDAAGPASPERLVRPRNAEGEPRRIGFELEFHGLEARTVAEIVARHLGGNLEQTDDKQFEVRDSRFGTFRIERDSHWLKEYERRREPIEGKDGFSYLAARAEDMWSEVVTSVVPLEVVSPPIPHTAFGEMEKLREALRVAGALGTTDSILYAFAVHLNIETPDLSPHTLLAYLQAFLLLQPWLQERVNLDMLRRMLPYANSFPDRFTEKVVAPDYTPETRDLIRDYIQFNPTRNRGLDLLPIFTQIDESAVLPHVEDAHLVKARPAFHYRLPNCHISNPTWTLGRDWELWLFVEYVAGKNDLRKELASRYYQTRRTNPMTSQSTWTKRIDEWARTIADPALWSI